MTKPGNTLPSRLNWALCYQDETGYNFSSLEKIKKLGVALSDDIRVFFPRKKLKVYFINTYIGGNTWYLEVSAPAEQGPYPVQGVSVVLHYCLMELNISKSP